MQPLTKVMQGATCTVKWALGLPETVEKLRELKIEQGSKLQVVCKSSDYMMDQNGMLLGMKLLEEFRFR